MRSRCLLASAALALALAAGPGAASATAAISGSVARLGEGGTPAALGGAVVTAAAPGRRPVADTTDSSGRFSLPVAAGGTYAVSAQADGYAAQAQAGVGANGAAAFVLSPSAFTPLPVNGGGAQATVADAASGVFYALASSGPELYRSDDYGGRWRPVTMSYDDPERGLRSDQGAYVAASSVSGEIVVASAAGVSTSTDYGLTWRPVGGGPGTFFASGAAGRSFALHWAHPRAGSATNVLVAAKPMDDGSWQLWRADMSAASPAFVRASGDPFGTGAAIAFAESGSRSFVGRVSAAGGLSFAELTAAKAIAFGAVQASGLPSPPRILRLGGAEAASAPPDGALVVGGSSPAALMLTKAAGAASFAGGSRSAATTLPAACEIVNPGSPAVGPPGSVTPTATGTNGAGTAGKCWVQKAGAALTVRAYPYFSQGGRAPDWSGMTYDAAWGRGNAVSFNGSQKYAALDAGGAPLFPGVGAFAKPGAGADTGGFSSEGWRSSQVEDTAFGPAGASQMAIAAGRRLASADGGRTVTEVVARTGPTAAASLATAWWRGASGDWLVFGAAMCNTSSLLEAARNWDGRTSLGYGTVAVAGSGCAALGGPAVGAPGFGGYAVLSLASVPGTDTAFVGLGTMYGGTRAPSHLYRVRLVPGSPPSLADVVEIGTGLHAPRALAYCPASSADAAMRDVLFAATGDGPPGPSAGALLRVTGATSGSPSVTEVASVPHGADRTELRDVRADCATGTVYAGGRAGLVNGWETAGLYKSIDGGRTFAALALPAISPGQVHETVWAIGLTPGSPNDVTVAATDAGATLHSADGGATWALVNDPATGRAATINDIEYPAPGGSASAASAPWLVRAAASSQRALVGSGSGAYRADLSAARGIFALGATASGTPRAAAQLTTLGSDARPALAATASGGERSAVFRRADGLARSAGTSAGWSAPVRIPKTSAGDDFAAAAYDGAGRLHVAFVRTRRAPGIYVATRSARGAWSAPRRVTTRSGDTLPAIAISGRAVHVAFLRTRGSRGVYDAWSSGGRWRTGRVRGTNAADASAALGGPALQARAGRLHLAFARRSGAAGIYAASATGTRWSAPARLTQVRGDGQPTLAIDRRGTAHIVFRRTAGRQRGLVELRGAARWSTTRIPATISGDTEPALATTGSTISLAFARPAGSRPGLYYAAASLNGRWRSKPRRWTGSRADRSPAVHVDTRGRISTVFERG